MGSEPGWQSQIHVSVHTTDVTTETVLQMIIGTVYAQEEHYFRI